MMQYKPKEEKITADSKLASDCLEEEVDCQLNFLHQNQN